MQPHTGSIFFALPNGGGVLFRMEGKATEPRESGTISREVRAKSVHYETFKVTNWLHRAQRFRCMLEIQTDANKVRTLDETFLLLFSLGNVRHMS